MTTAATFDPKEIFVESLSTISASNVSKRCGEQIIGAKNWDLGAADVIVVQLGSRNMRVGMARDAFSRIIPCAMAIATIKNDSTISKDDDESNAFVPSKNVLNFNNSAKAEVILGHNDIDAFDWLIPNPVICGLGISQVDRKYERIYPLSRGRFYGEPRETIDKLYKIMKGIGMEFSGMRLVLVVEEEMNEEELCALCDLALNQLNVAAVAFLKEAVAACFGTGVSSGVVIDIGATHTRISAVEDGTTTKTITILTISTMEDKMKRVLKEEGWPNEALDALPLERILTLDESERNSIHGHAVEVTCRRQNQDARRYDLWAGNSRFLVPESILFCSNDSNAKDLISMISHILDGSTEEQTQKLLQNIILVGGYALIPHLPQMLLDRLLEAGLVGSITGGMDPRQVAWKGGAVYSRLESVNDNGWLTRDEWNAKGVRGVHEKCIFNFQ